MIEFLAMIEAKSDSVHLMFSEHAAEKAGIKGCPRQVLKDLGITFSHSTRQTLYDQYWFWNCRNIPEKLPDYLRRFNPSPEVVKRWAKP